MEQAVAQQVDLKPFREKLKSVTHKEGAVIPLLQMAQELYGYVPADAMEEISTFLNMEVSQIYGVATFYAQFRLKPVGKNIIRVCHGTACHVAGAERVTERCEELLDIHNGETTEDRNFTLEKVACVGCCSLAPVMMIGDETYGRLTDKEIKKIINDYKSNE